MHEAASSAAQQARRHDVATGHKPADETLLRYAGWRAVLACFLMALFLFGFGLYGQGIYLVELQRLNGWPPALISGASTLSSCSATSSRPSPANSWPVGREAARVARNRGARGIDACWHRRHGGSSMSPSS